MEPFAILVMVLGLVVLHAYRERLGITLGGDRSPHRGRTDFLATTVSDDSTGSPTSAHNGSGGEAVSAFDISEPIIGDYAQEH